MFTLLQAAPAAGQEGAQGAGWTNILLLVGIVVIFYFFMIRPQQKRNKEQKKFRESLAKGNKVVTIGGIHGKIVELQETTVTIEVDNNVKLKMEKTAIASSIADQISE